MSSEPNRMVHPQGLLHQSSVPAASPESSAPRTFAVSSPMRRASSPGDARLLGQPPQQHQGSPDQHGRVIGFGLGLRGEADKKRTMVWAWGSTGEEKWNPEIEIGMDWKSLVRSALLPITTDFFPDGKTLKDEYSVTEHQILVDDALQAQMREVAKLEPTREGKTVVEPSAAQAVFNQLICQRLQRGFQIVLLPEDLIAASIRKTGGTRIAGADINEEVILSFSSIYHRLLLVCNDRHQEIIVSEFTPKPPVDDQGKVIVIPPPPDVVYSYFFQVPDSDVYEESTTTFKPHNLDKLRWSQLDTNLQSKNPALFADDMKSYSCRIMLVPAAESALHAPPPRHGVTPPSAMVPSGASREAVAAFGREVLGSRGGWGGLGGGGGGVLAAMDSSAFSSPCSSVGTTCASPTGGVATQLPACASELNNGLVRLLLSMNRLQHSEDHASMQQQKRDAALQEWNNRPRLTTDTPAAMIVERFMASKYMLESMPGTREPIGTGCIFLSYDLINWLMSKVDDLGTQDSALNYANDVLVNDYIAVVRPSDAREDDTDSSCLSSESGGRRILAYAYQYAYFPMHRNNGILPKYCRVDFVNRGCPAHLPSTECFFRTAPTTTILREPDMEFPLGEWGRIDYERSYCEGKAYEFTMRWCTASGNTVADMIAGWRRRAEGHGFYLFPVPEDVFALPTDVDSNPLRCPIAIRVVDGAVRKEELPGVMRSLLHHVGFISMQCHVHSQCTDNSSQAFVHWTGGMFASLEIPDPRERTRTRSEEERARARGDGSDEDVYTRPFFFWSWNHMLSHRYRTTRDVQRSGNVFKDANCCTEAEQDRALREVREYCGDKEKLARFARALNVGADYVKLL